ncbi:VWA domain-containing protein [Archangium sp. Cb G35]|uniref:VWA domain-containing protein n=1 Tax=Archangium sp. Cb G35 TaxID=1920190 RepID=UPI001300DA98|nr:VWA domain-containing protein [Archangium sp. Cb G35]
MSAAMEQAVSGQLTASPLDIPCNGATTVKVTLDAGSSTSGRPVDIMLVLDRSGSMAGSMGTLKEAAMDFVDKFDAGDGAKDGVFANGSRIGMVSFASEATLDRPLTSTANSVKTAINGLVASGQTNHEAGISTGQGQLASSPNARVMIIFTDGNTTAGDDPLDDAERARNAGTEIFGIGLGNSINQNAVRSWVSAPVSEHAYFTEDAGTLQQIFDEIGTVIVRPAATQVVVKLAVQPSFSASGASASKGSVSASPSLITWSIDQLMSETVTLTYVATHDNLKPGGALPIHASATYSDAEGNVVMFANPTVNVRGCAAILVLTPKVGTHYVGETHTVFARVLDDFGDPVSGVTVGLSVTGGPSIVDGEPSAPTPSAGSGITDANGQVPFSYTNVQASPDTITATAAVQPNVSRVLTDTAAHTWLPLPASIDIKPHSDPSSYGANSKGNIPVALIGSATFNVTQVDNSTVYFGDAPTTIGDALAKRGAIEDYNSDGVSDKVFHFYFPATHLDPTDVEGCLSGEIRGLDFLGCSDVNIVRRLKK